jgi:hypothetical protein
MKSVAAISPVLIVIFRYPHCFKHSDMSVKKALWQAIPLSGQRGEKRRGLFSLQF